MNIQIETNTQKKLTQNKTSIGEDESGEKRREQ